MNMLFLLLLPKGEFLAIKNKINNSNCPLENLHITEAY